MTPKQVALISPRDGFACLVSHDRDEVVLLASVAQAGRTIPVCNYLSRFPDTIAVRVSDRQEVIKYLGEYQDRSLALDFALLLFDGEVSRETRSKIAHELEELLNADDCREYVLDILLAKPLPDSADFGGADEIANPLGRVCSLVHSVVQAQTRDAAAHAAWLEVRRKRRPDGQALRSHSR
jgi:hypothetical protein